MSWEIAHRVRLGETAAAALVGALAAFIAPVVGGDTATQFACAVVLLAGTIVVAVGLDWRRTGDKLSILTLVGLFYLLAFVAGSVYVWFNPSWGVAVPAHQPFSHAALTRAQWLCLFSWVAFAIGYRVRLLGFLPVRPLKLSARSRETQDLTMIGLYGVGWAARLAGISRGLYFHPVATSVVASGSTSNQILHVLGVLPLVAVAYLGVRRHKQQGLKWYYRGALALELGFALPSGNRVDAVAVLLLAVVVAYYTNRRLPLRAIAVSAVFLLFFAFPVLYLYRTSNNDTGYQVHNLATGVTTYTSSGVGNVLLYGIGSTLSRFADIRLPAGLEERGRNAYPISEGGTIGWIFTNYIPHAIDPHKRSLIQFIDDLAYAVRVTPVHNSSFATTTVGELYLDFGTLGACVAMLVLGSLYRELDEWLVHRRDTPLVLALYAAFAYEVIQAQEPLLALGLGALIRNMLVLAILIWATTWLLDRSASKRVTQERLPA